MARSVSIVLMPILLLLSQEHASAQKRYKVSIDSLPQGAALYLEDKEAGIQGKTPHAFQLEKGTYTFILESDGYETLTRTIEISRPASFTFTLTRKPSPATLVVKAAAGSDTAGAQVKVNGKATGAVPTTLNIQQGRYQVEVAKDGYETYSEWIDVQPGEQRTLVITLARSAAGTGTLLVSSNIVGAEVFVDGKRVDTAPALLEKLPPGKRTVEVRAKGYLVKQQEVSIEPGKTVKITLELQPDQKTVAASSGTLQVLTSHKDVEILVDGKSGGKAPVKIEGLAEGSHLVEAHKPGMASAEKTVTLKKGEFATIKLNLKEAELPKRTGAIRVISPVLGASVFIDGTLSGKTPLLRHQLDPGPHFVAVRARGYEELIQSVEVKAGQISELKAVLTRSTSTDEEPKISKEQVIETTPAQDRTRGLSSYGAQLVDPGYFTADLSLGYVHIFEGRLTAGVFSKNSFGLDGGVEFRTYFAMTEIGIHAKLRLLQRSIFSLAMLFSIGGGGGPASRNTFYSNLGLVTSLWFKKLITFSGRAFFGFYSDRLCPGSPDSSEASGCSTSKNLTQDQVRSRNGGARFFLSAILEVPVALRGNLFAILEGAPFQGNRLSYSDPFASIMPESDPGVYFRVGVSFKY